MTTSKHRIPCPHCDQNLRIRKSQGLTPLYREAIAECRNDDCGFRAKARIELCNTLTPSDMPNPAIDLPFAPSLISQAIKQAQRKS